MLAISLCQLPESYGAIVRPVHIRRHGGCAVGGTHRAGDPSLSAGVGGKEFVRGFPGQPRRRQVDIPHRAFQTVIRLRNRSRVERVGFNDLRACLEIGAVNPPDHIGSGDCQDVVVTLEISVMGGKAVAPKIFFAQRMPLHHGSHGPVHQHNPLGQRLFQQAPL